MSLVTVSVSVSVTYSTWTKSEGQIKADSTDMIVGGGSHGHNVRRGDAVPAGGAAAPDSGQAAPDTERLLDPEVGSTNSATFSTSIPTSASRVSARVSSQTLNDFMFIKVRRKGGHFLDFHAMLRETL